MALPVETPPVVQIASQVTVVDLMDDEDRAFLLQSEQAGAEEDL